MAETPSNTTATGGSALPRPGDLLRKAYGVPAAEAAAPNVLGAYQPVDPGISDLTSAIQSGKTGFDIGKPLGAPSATKVSAPPAGYSPYVVGPNGGTAVTGQQAVNPAIRQLPFGGQYNIDLANPTALVKSQRADSTNTPGLPSHENSLVLGPLSNKMFQVDHIVPLWAGGADTLANKQNLAVPVHAVKTKIQAVPQALLFAGDIDRNQALAMALNWQSRSAKGIPEITNDKPYMDTETARAIYKQWQHDDKFGPKTTIGDVLKAVPEASDSFGKDIGLPEWARQLIIGTASGLTAGGVPLRSSAEANAFDKIMGLAGQVVGTVVGVGKFAKLVQIGKGGLGRLAGMGAKSGLAAKFGVSAARGAGPTAGDLLGGKALFEPIAGAAQKAIGGSVAQKGIAGVLGRMKTAASPQTVLSNLKAMNVRAALGQAADNAAAFALYGQAGQTLADFTQEQDNVLSSHVHRLADDLVLGGVTGLLPGTWKGSIGVAGATFSLGMMTGDSPREALSEAMALGALHRVGGFAVDITKQQAAQTRIVDDAATKGAVTVLDTMAGPGAGLPKINLKGDAPAKDSYTPEQVDEWAAKAMDNLREMGVRNTTQLKNGVDATELLGGSGRLSLEEYFSGRARIMAAASYLKNRTLPTELWEKQMALDLTSFSKHLRNKYDLDNISTPNALLPAVERTRTKNPALVEAVPERIFTRDRWEYKRAPEGEGTPEFNGLRGDFRITGQAANLMNEKTMKNYISALEKGEASPTLFVVRQPEMAPFIRDLNRAITPEMQASKEHFIDKNPENVLGVFGVLKTPEGWRTVQLGHVPSENRIGTPKGVDEKTGELLFEGNKYAFNKEADIAKTKKYEPDNHLFNKDTLGMGFVNHGIQVLPVNVRAFTQTADKSAKPYIIVNVTDSNWRMAKEMAAENGGAQATGNFEDNIALAMVDGNKKNVDAVITKAAQQLAEEGESATTIVRSIPETISSEPRQKALFELHDKTKDVIATANTPEQVAEGFEKQLGIALKPEEAAFISKNRETITGGEARQVVETAITEGRASPYTAANYDVYVKPLLKTETYKNSPEAKLAEKMPLLSTRDTGTSRASRVSGKAVQQKETETTQSVAADIHERLDSIFDSYEAPSIIGRQLQRADIIRDIKAKIQGIDVDRRGLPAFEYERIKRQAIKDYGAYGKGAETTHNIIPAREEANYLSNRTSGEDTLLEDIVQADTARRFGLNDDVTKILSRYDEPKLDEARRQLFPKMMGEGEEEWLTRTEWMMPKKEVPKSDLEIEAEKLNRIEGVPAAIKADADNFFNSLNEGVRTLPKDSYGYSFDTTVLGGIREAFGHSKKPLEENYDFMRFLSGTGEHGSAFYKNLFSTVDSRTGKPISQPKKRTNAMAQGAHGKKLKEMSAERAEELKGENPLLSKEETTNLGLDEYGSGYKVETPQQSDNFNYKDLTYLDSQVMPGRVALEGGEDAFGNALPKITETQAGIEDGKRFVQHLMSEYNKYIDSARAGGKQTPNKMRPVKDDMWAKITAPIEKSSTSNKRNAQLVERARKEIEEIKKNNEMLEGVGGTRAGIYAKQAKEENAARMEELQTFLDKYGDKFKTTKEPDGQGGPGFQIFNQPKFTPPDVVAAADSSDTALNPRTWQALPEWQPSSAKLTDGADQMTPIKFDTVDTQPGMEALKNIETAKANKTKQLSTLLGSLQQKASQGWDYINGVTRVERAPTKSGDPIVMGYNIKNYATDPTHETKVASIANAVSNLATTTQIESYIRSKFPESPLNGQMIKAAADKHGVPAPLLIAILQQDSSLGTAGLAVKTRNAGNYGNDDAGNIRTFPTWDAGVDAVAGWLARNRAN